ncbi:NUDIX domain-containing protein [Qipengyuania sp. JC766]|uniref:NUDIX hydrolase n=1 Tax=Qipengyuania sp. JC766 TaxID=3232139 RepID=UPI0034584596
MDSPSPAPASDEAIPAATLVVFRRAADGGAPEFLMVTRSRSLAFAGGMVVFPGGRVDPADLALAATLETPLDAEEAAHRIAAIRETLEETGLAVGFADTIDAASAARARDLLLETGRLATVLDDTGWRLELDRLLPFARWHPKNEKLSRVFDTRFYLVDIGTGAVQVAVDETENSRLFWSSASDTLAAADRGELSVIYPTRRNLERLARFRDFDEAAEDCARHPVRTVTPFLQERDGVTWLCIDDDLGYPVTGEPIDAAMRG